MSAKDKVLVYCHDAGSAEIVSAYVRRHTAEKDFFCYAHGPAKKIFGLKGIPYIPLDEEVTTAEDLLDGTELFQAIIAEPSWRTPFGIKLIAAGKRRGIRTITYLDHWVNHRQQFGYPRLDWEGLLPDELWVGDEYAEKTAKRWFLGKSIKLVPNLYFEEFKEACSNKMYFFKVDPRLILFLSEPISDVINTFGDREDIIFTETEVLESLLEYLSTLHSYYRVLIRMHPSEDDHKYSAVLDKYAEKLEIRVSSGTTLSEDFALVTHVIGMDTMALALALICGKRAISLMPDPKRTCDLPYPGIVKIKNVAELGQYLH